PLSARSFRLFDIAAEPLSSSSASASAYPWSASEEASPSLKSSKGAAFPPMLPSSVFSPSNAFNSCAMAAPATGFGAGSAPSTGILPAVRTGGVFRITGATTNFSA
ncbi:unnamed protein product, partial [Phaeothamnion confervicola]